VLPNFVVVVVVVVAVALTEFVVEIVVGGGCYCDRANSCCCLQFEHLGCVVRESAHQSGSGSADESWLCLRVLPSQTVAVIVAERFDAC